MRGSPGSVSEDCIVYRGYNQFNDTRLSTPSLHFSLSHCAHNCPLHASVVRPHLAPGYKQLTPQYCSGIKRATLFWAIIPQMSGRASEWCPGGWSCVCIDITAAIMSVISDISQHKESSGIIPHPLAAPHASPLCSDKMTIFLEIQSMQNICLILCKSSGPTEMDTHYQNQYEIFEICIHHSGSLNQSKFRFNNFSTPELGLWVLLMCSHVDVEI